MIAKDFDKFRLRYGEMRAAEVQEFYERLHAESPNQSYGRPDLLVEFLQKVKPRQVFELGGADGRMAALALPELPDIVMWFNREIAKWPNNCGYNRYVASVRPYFAWDRPILRRFDTLVASHVLEHISREQCGMLLNRLPFLRYAYIDYPRRPDDGWHGTCAHVNDLSIDGVVGFMRGRGFRLVFDEETGVEDSHAMGFRRDS